MLLLQVSVNTELPAAAGETVLVPDALWVPLHAPLAVQVVPLVADHVSVALCPCEMVVGATDRVTLAGGIAEPP